MSSTEFLVIIFGLFIGYLLVSRFGGGKPGPNPSAPQAGQQEQQRHEQAGTPPPPPWAAVLQVAPTADTEEIRRAYKTLMSQYHPDKVASLGPELKDLCERKSKEINAAYNQAMAAHGAKR